MGIFVNDVMPKIGFSSFLAAFTIKRLYNLTSVFPHLSIPHLCIPTSVFPPTSAVLHFQTCLLGEGSGEVRV